MFEIRQGGEMRKGVFVNIKTPKPVWIGVLYSRLQIKNATPAPQPCMGSGVALMVDANGIEPLTLRTSSECSTS